MTRVGMHGWVWTSLKGVLMQTSYIVLSSFTYPWQPEAPAPPGKTRNTQLVFISKWHYYTTKNPIYNARRVRALIAMRSALMFQK